MRSPILWGIACVAVWLALCAAIGLVAVEGALHPRRVPLTSSEREDARSVAARNHAVLTDTVITADDGAIPARVEHAAAHRQWRWGDPSAWSGRQ
jgi:hypothetical protein